LPSKAPAGDADIGQDGEVFGDVLLRGESASDSKLLHIDTRGRHSAATLKRERKPIQWT
jgi:hypothetical protein